MGNKRELRSKSRSREVSRSKLRKSKKARSRSNSESRSRSRSKKHRSRPGNGQKKHRSRSDRSPKQYRSKTKKRRSPSSWRENDESRSASRPVKSRSRSDSRHRKHRSRLDSEPRSKSIVAQRRARSTSKSAPLELHSSFPRRSRSPDPATNRKRSRSPTSSRWRGSSKAYPPLNQSHPRQDSPFRQRSKKARKYLHGSESERGGGDIGDEARSKVDSSRALVEASSENGAEVWEVGVSNGESYFKPPNPPSQMSQFTRCRICFSYYENDVEQANKHIRLHPAAAFKVKAPSEFWYFDIEEVIAHFAKMQFRKDTLKDKLFEMNLVNFPETLVGYSCSACPPSKPSLNATTNKDFKDHLMQCANPPKRERDKYRISWCRGCHTRFKSDLDLKNHIEMTAKSRCFPNQGIVDRVFREALMESPDHHRRHNKHQPAPQVKVEPLGSRSLNAGERLGNVKPELGMAQDYSLMTGHSGLSSRSSLTLPLGLPEENFLPDDFPSFGVSPPRYECQPVSNLTLSCSPPSSRINFDAYSDCQARIPPVMMPPAALNINKESLEEILRTVNETPSFICQTEAKAAVVVATSPTVNEILSDDDEIVVIEEVTSAEACRLSHCYWNGAHVPGCLRFEISRRCGTGLCVDNDLHQHSGFQQNKFAKAAGINKTNMCPNLVFYANFKTKTDPKRLVYSDDEVQSIPHERVKIEDSEATVSDPRLEAGRQYPRPLEPFPEIFKRYPQNNRFVVVDWSNRKWRFKKGPKSYLQV